MYFAPFLKSQIQLAANWPRIAINCDYYLPLTTHNALVFWAMVLRYFSGTNAHSQIIEGSLTKTEVTKALKAISVIFHSCRWYQKQIEISSRVWQDLKTEQKNAYHNKKPCLLEAGQEENKKNYSLKRCPQYWKERQQMVRKKKKSKTLWTYLAEQTWPLTSQHKGKGSHVKMASLRYIQKERCLPTRLDVRVKQTNTKMLVSSCRYAPVSARLLGLSKWNFQDRKHDPTWEYLHAPHTAGAGDEDDKERSLSRHTSSTWRTESCKQTGLSKQRFHTRQSWHSRCLVQGGRVYDFDSSERTRMGAQWASTQGSFRLKTFVTNCSSGFVFVMDWRGGPGGAPVCRHYWGKGVMVAPLESGDQRMLSRLGCMIKGEIWILTPLCSSPLLDFPLP